ncbi:hypothetical protein [Streptomyces mirabilis]|uniref:hypothetical protein n=1 Tax=Streptomyces mirabilis TaxID=68239 RepID=UPI003D9F1019
MTGVFTTAGFRLAVISEPRPDPAARGLFPNDFHGLSTKTCFLIFVVEVPPSATGSDDWVLQSGSLSGTESG